MALIKCDECGKEVSTSAESCPSCGYPVGKEMVECPDCRAKIPANADFCPECHVIQVKKPVKGTNVIPTKKKGWSRKKKEIWMIIGVIFVLFMGYRIYQFKVYLDNEEKQQKNTAQKVAEVPKGSIVSNPPESLNYNDKDGEAKSLKVRGKMIEIGDTADDIFETLKPADSKKKDVGPDPTNPQSLLVTHHYEIEGKSFSLTFARTTDPGPYRLIRISTSSTPKVAPTSSSILPRLTKKQVLEARSKYKIEVLSFDASKRYGSEFPFSDFVRLQVTNGSSVVLPFLTIRTNRYSKGAEVGWSRAPVIPIDDLKPGQSKEIDYYPKGHLDVVLVDRISVQIESQISKQDRQYFKELEQAQ